MAFPKRKLFGLITDGWTDRGNVSRNYTGDNTYTSSCCGDCETKARIGIEESGERFMFCKKCIIKIKKKSTT